MTISRFQKLFLVALIISAVPVSKTHSTIIVGTTVLPESVAVGIGLGLIGSCMVATSMVVAPLNIISINAAFLTKVTGAIGVSSLGLSVISFLFSKNKERQLREALRTSDIEKVKNALRWGGAAINPFTMHPLLVQAATNNQMDIVHLLKEGGVSIDQSFKVACETNKSQAVRALLQAGHVPTCEQTLSSYSKAGKQVLDNQKEKFAAILKNELDKVCPQKDANGLILEMLTGNVNHNKVKFEQRKKILEDLLEKRTINIPHIQSLRFWPKVPELGLE